MNVNGWDHKTRAAFKNVHHSVVQYFIPFSALLHPIPPALFVFFFSLFNADNRDEGEKRQRIACKTRPRIVDKRQRQTAFLWLRLNNKTINFHYRLATVSAGQDNAPPGAPGKAVNIIVDILLKCSGRQKKKNANKKILVEYPTFESPQRFQFVWFLLFTTTFT